MSQQKIDELANKIEELEAEINILKLDNKYLNLRLKIELERNEKK